MNKRNLGPVVLVLVAVASGLLVYWLMDGGPKTKPSQANTPDETAERQKPAGNEPARNRPAPENIEPDPVRNDRPQQPYTIDTSLPRILVEGDVTDSNGVGLPDIEVTFTGDMALRGVFGTGYTDATGRYRLLAWAANKNSRSASPDRKGTVVARAPDGGQGATAQFAVPAGDSCNAPPIKLAAGGAIEGIATDAQGGPAAGARITIRSSQPVSVLDTRAREPRVVNRVVMRVVHADSAGRFKAANLPAAGYRITGDPGYPGHNPNAAGAEVSEGRSAWVELALKGDNYIRGQVLDATGQPVPGAVVTLARPTRTETGEDGNTIKPAIEAVERGDSIRRADEGIRRFDDTAATNTRQMTDGNGRFGFYSLEDIEWVVAARIGQAEDKVPAQRINQPDITLRLATQDGAFVSGTVTDAETGLPVEAFDLRSLPGTGSADPDPFAKVADDRVFPWRPSGAYRLVNPPSGEFRIRVTAPGYAPAIVQLKALGPGEHRAGIDMQLLPLCELYVQPTLDGRRLDFEPVMLLFDERLAYQAATDALGEVRIPGVAPGRYKLKLVQADGTVHSADLEVPARRRATLGVNLSPGG